MCIREFPPVRRESPLSMSNLTGGFHHVFPLVTSPTCLVLSCCSYIKVPNIDRISLLLRFCFFHRRQHCYYHHHPHPHNHNHHHHHLNRYTNSKLCFFCKMRARFKSLHTIQLIFQSLGKLNVDIL